MFRRVSFLASLLVIAAMACVGLLYIADYLVYFKYNPRESAVNGVASWAAARVAIDPEGGVSVGDLVARLQATAVRDVPVVVVTGRDLEQRPGAILVAEGLGIECVAIVVDETDPFRGVRRVWIPDAAVVDAHRVTAKDASRRAFVDTGVVEGGDVFTY